jgi:hypothetical protein
MLYHPDSTVPPLPVLSNIKLCACQTEYADMREAFDEASINMARGDPCAGKYVPRMQGMNHTTLFSQLL